MSPRHSLISLSPLTYNDSTLSFDGWSKAPSSISVTSGVPVSVLKAISLCNQGKSDSLIKMFPSSKFTQVLLSNVHIIWALLAILQDSVVNHATP